MPQTHKNFPQCFDHIISLGGNCETTASLRRYFNIHHMYPFDWWITPLQSVSVLIKNQFADLFNKEAFEISADQSSVFSHKYCILHHHDFARNKKKRLNH